MISRHAECAQPLDDRGVQLALGIQRAAGEAVDGDDRPILRMREIRSVGEAMRLVDDQLEVAVLRWGLERRDHRVVDRVDDGDFLAAGVRAANLDKGSRHCAIT